MAGLLQRQASQGAALLLLTLGTTLMAEGFEVRLGLENAHLVEVFFGCHPAGSDGYDRELDDFAPPPGFDTGYVGFVPPAKLPPFYKDIRGPAGPHDWKLLVRAAKERPVRLSWDAKALPAGWAFTILRDGSQPVAMAATTTLAVDGTATLLIRGAQATVAPPPPTQVQTP